MIFSLVLVVSWMTIVLVSSIAIVITSSLYVSQKIQKLNLVGSYLLSAIAGSCLGLLLYYIASFPQEHEFSVLFVSFYFPAIGITAGVMLGGLWRGSIIWYKPITTTPTK